ncbi:MAG: hypothetical protein JSV12_05545 [Candidatus Bathyarchaeota archaeon]|nr:MAG: hypothetical protein JSV12_05545 [Candidatus Bathyarchaeota archaeon]
MKRTMLVFSFILMFIGLSFGYVYGNPFGFVIDGIGFVIFLYAIFAKNEKPRFVSRKQYLKSTHREDYRCGTCFWFGKPGCKRNEEFINAEPCEDYMLRMKD